MEKTMPLDLLSSIKGARSSEAINELFKVIMKAVPDNQRVDSFEVGANALFVNELRNDEVLRCDEDQKELIRQNFPEEKNGFLVVPKVIEE
jgi:aspartyl/glutamyl-tRNA(Asn/Gln) amidotransferase C subunit